MKWKTEQEEIILFVVLFGGTRWAWHHEAHSDYTIGSRFKQKNKLEKVVYFIRMYFLII